MEGHVRADLHLHTIASDGRWGPGKLIEELLKVGVGLFSVTDHDSLGSLAETAVRVQDSGLCFLPGVELSARLDGQLYHLLGYGFDPTEPELNRFVEANGAMLQGASDDAVRLLAEAGHPVSLDDYAAFTWDRHRGGWKALNYLIDRGLCQDIRGYFDVLFAGELVHPQPEFPPPEEVIAVIRQARGLVSLAHPGALFYNGVDERLLDRLVEMGLAGVECYSFHHDQAITRGLLAYCQRRDLLITGGSDCHGGFVGRPLGIPPIRVKDLRLGVLEERTIG
jgi:predicted metal-dependent phosphoesterase TrpH